MHISRASWFAGCMVMPHRCDPEVQILRGWSGGQLACWPGGVERWWDVVGFVQCSVQCVEGVGRDSEIVCARLC